MGSLDREQPLLKALVGLARACAITGVGAVPYAHPRMMVNRAFPSNDDGGHKNSKSAAHERAKAGIASYTSNCVTNMQTRTYMCAHNRYSNKHLLDGRGQLAYQSGVQVGGHAGLGRSQDLVVGPLHQPALQLKHMRNLGQGLGLRKVGQQEGWGEE